MNELKYNNKINKKNKNMNDFIILTSNQGDMPIIISIKHIGHFYRVSDEYQFGKISKKAYTNVGVTTHNNGGFKVRETPEEIIKMINLLPNTQK